MKNAVLVFVLFSLLCGVIGAQTATDPGPSWPHPIPCRIQDGTNRDLFVMTLGKVETPIADGIFDPVKDEVTLKDGSVKQNYYRDVLGVKQYQPLDKSRFPLPPSGWCTWYYYYNRINATEVKRNAEWIAANLKAAGVRQGFICWYFCGHIISFRCCYCELISLGLYQQGQCHARDASFRPVEQACTTRREANNSRPESFQTRHQSFNSPKEVLNCRLNLRERELNPFSRELDFAGRL